jgi:hypothetical protein
MSFEVFEPIPHVRETKGPPTGTESGIAKRADWQNDPPMTPEETFRALRCSRGTLYNLVRRGLLHPIRYSRRVFFKASEVQRLIS